MMITASRKKNVGEVMEKDPQLVLLFFQILNRLVFLVQGFVRRKNMRSMELESESVLPTIKHLLQFPLVQ